MIAPADDKLLTAILAYCQSGQYKEDIDLPEKVATRVTVIFYADTRDALLKALAE